jgi:uncharacterized integral membrane protein
MDLEIADSGSEAMFTSCQQKLEWAVRVIETLLLLLLLLLPLVIAASLLSCSVWPAQVPLIVRAPSAWFRAFPCR